MCEKEVIPFTTERLEKCMVRGFRDTPFTVIWWVEEKD
jgi:hypothetical protein